MKNKIEILKYIFKTDIFKLIIILSIGVGLFAGNYLTGLTIPNSPKGYFASLSNIYTSQTFHTIFLVILLINSLYTLKTFEKLDFYIIRIKNKKKYIKELISLVTISNISIILLELGIILCCLNINSSFSLGIVKHSIYNISNIQYILFFFTRYMIITVILSNINILLLKLFNKIFVLIVDISFLTSLFFIPYDTRILNSVQNLPLFPQKYYLPLHCSSFSLEIVMSISIIFILVLVLYTVSTIVCHKTKQVIE